MKTSASSLKSRLVRCATLFAAVAASLLAAPVHAQAADAIYVATYVEVRPTSAAAGAKLVAAYQGALGAEPGSLAATALQEIGRPSRFVVIESWADQAAFTAHDKAANTLEFRAKLGAIQSAPYDQRVNHGFAIDPQTAAAGTKRIYVVTHVDVPGAMREGAEKLLQQLAQASRSGSGHFRYDVYQQVDPRTNHFTVFAAWDTPRAFETYAGSSPALQFRTALAPMLGALYDERLYRSIGK